jgi:hypothetical protein
MTDLRKLLLVGFLMVLATNPWTVPVHGGASTSQRQPVPCGPTDC